MAASANFVLLRFEKHQGNPAKRIEDHHERNKEEYKSNPDVDTSKSSTNFHIIEPQTSYKQAIEQRITAAGCRARKDSVRFIDTMVAVSPNYFKKKTPQEIRNFFTEACGFFEKQIGRENIVSAVVHMDEKTPHMHLVFVPITKDNRLCAKEIIGNRTRLIQWQDDFYAHMAVHYPDLERGESASRTGRQHDPTRLYKEAAHLSKQADRINSLMDARNLFNGKETDARIRKLLKSLIPNLERFNTEFKQYDSSIRVLQEENNELKTDLKAASATSIRKQLADAKLQAVYENLKRLFARIPPDVVQAAKHPQTLESKAHPCYAEGGITQKGRENPCLFVVLKVIASPKADSFFKASARA